MTSKPNILRAFRPSVPMATALVLLFAAVSVWKTIPPKARTKVPYRAPFIYQVEKKPLPTYEKIDPSVPRLATPPKIIAPPRSPKPSPQPPQSPISRLGTKAAVVVASSAAAKKAVASTIKKGEPLAAKPSPKSAPVAERVVEESTEADQDADNEADSEDREPANSSEGLDLAERLLNEELAEDSQAIDRWDALNEISETAFNEVSPEGDYHAEAAQSATQLDTSLGIDSSQPREARLVLKEGTIQQGDFSSLRESLSAAEIAAGELGAPPTAAAAEAEDGPFLVRAKKSGETEVAKAPTTTKEPELVRPTPRRLFTGAVTAPESKLASLSPSRTLDNTSARPVLAATPEPVLVKPEHAEPITRESILSEMATATPNPLSASGPVVASVGSLPVVSQPAPKLNTQTPTRTLDARVDFPTKGLTTSGGTPSGALAHAPGGLPQPRPVSSGETTGHGMLASRGGDEVSMDSDEEGGALLGRVSVDKPLEQWLTAKGGHIELYLHPVKSRDPQDTIFIEYQYPEDSFEFDGTNLKGSYRLIAGFYIPGATAAVAQVAHPEPISVATYRKKILFKLTKAQFDAAQKTVASRAPALLLTATLFEGATGDYRRPKAIPGAQVKVVGLPGLGTYTSDAEGNVRIPRVPGRSQLVLEVTAAGYYTAMPVVPTFESNVYAPVYLISRDKVDAITRYFTKNLQQNKYGLIMGRVFEPQSRAPMAGQPLSLSFRKGRTLYFNSLPDLQLSATSSTGLFGFFNVIPSFRSVNRPGKPGLIVNTRPGTAEYIEFGRGGKATLSGRLSDPFHDQIPTAKVRIVGSPDTEVETGADGSFVFPDIDFPPGVITLEVEAEGYPLTWHSVAWNSHERQTQRHLFLMEKELITESAARVAKTKLRGDRGVIVGGSEAGFFKPRYGCVTAGLARIDGDAVAAESGPFPLMGDRPEPNRSLCLSPAKPGFTFLNLVPGEYLLKWQAADGQIVRTRVVHVGLDRVTVVVN